MIAKENNIGTLKSLKKQNKPDTEDELIKELLNESRLEVENEKKEENYDLDDEEHNWIDCLFFKLIFPTMNKRSKQIAICKYRY